MDAVMVDTNVLAYLMKPGDTRAALYAPHVQGKSIAVSFVTVGELYAWSIKPGYQWSAKRVANLEERLRSLVIVPFDDALCRAYAAIAYLKTPHGSARTIPANDRWIAASAIRHSVPLVSHNKKHLENIPGLILISEAP